MAVNRSLFGTLPKELIAENHDSIGGYLSKANQYRLSRLDKHLNLLFKASASQYVQQFINYVIRGNVASVIKMLEQDPSLLLEYGTVKDYSGRIFKQRTALQLMLSACDPDMIETIKPYFAKLENGQAQFDKQVQEQFPKGLVDVPGFDFNSLVKIISNSTPQEIQDALNKQQNSSVLCHALNEFRNVFTRLSMSEENFNPNHLLNALRSYGAAFDGWDEDKRDLFWRQVVGFTQRFLPSNFAQDAAQGFYYRVVKNEESNRSFTARFSGGAIFPISAPSSMSGLGFDYAIGGWGWVGMGCTHIKVAGLEHFLNLCRTKKANVEKIIGQQQPINQEQVSHSTRTIV